MQMTKDSATRIRDNQRRSRARHKEYVRDLEQRVERFEKQGVQATLEVQAAGRKVAEENKLLRSLLRSRGVTDAEIEEYLRGHNAGQNSVSGSPNMPLADNNACPQQSGRSCCPGQTGSNGSMKLEATVRSNPPVQTLGRNGQVPPVPTTQDPGHLSNKYSLSSGGCGTLVPVQPGTRAHQALSEGNRSGHATPCEAAARIIASMRHDSDMQEMRAELGCSSDASCMVDNMVIFRALDR